MQAQHLHPTPHCNRPPPLPVRLPQHWSLSTACYCRASAKNIKPQRQLVVAAAKAKGPVVQHVCSKCGAQHPRWYGTCKECGATGTIEKQERWSSSGPASTGAGTLARAAAEAQQLVARTQRIAEYEGSSYSHAGSSTDEVDAAAASWGVTQPSPARGRSQSWLAGVRGGQAGRGVNAPVSLTEAASRTHQGYTANRMVLMGRTGQEINRVLGGGVVSGSLVLVGGEPGVGKSTLSLQIAAMLAQPDLDYDMLSEMSDSERSDDDDSSSSRSWDSRSQLGQQSSSGSQDAWETSSPNTNGSGRSSSAVKQSRRKVSSPKPRLKLDGSSSSNGAAASPHMGPEGGEGGTTESSDGDVPVAGGVQPRKVLYVSGEETVEQVADRGKRMGLHECSTLHVLAECCLEDVMTQVLVMQPAAVVVDSVQTMYLRQLDNVSGSVVQLKECCSSLLRLAKDYNITVFAIGHVTKSSDIAGPKALEHMVDAVLRLEGDMTQSYRLLRAGKNRFGTTDEVGVFCMDVGGLHAVADPASMFLAQRSSGSSAIAVVMDGTRVLVLEVQALVTPQHPQSKVPPVRQTTAANKDRVLAIIINVLHKYVMRMSMQNVVVNITGGIQIRDPASDLAVAVAIASSYYDVPVPRDVAAIGEMDLGGGLRPIPHLDLRLAELARLKLRSVVFPMTKDVAKLRRDPRLAGLDLVPCSTLLEALQHVLGPRVGAKGEGKRRRQQSVDAAMDDADDGDEYE